MDQDTSVEPTDTPDAEQVGSVEAEQAVELTETGPTLRVAYETGMMPAKWFDRWRDRLPGARRRAVALPQLVAVQPVVGGEVQRPLDVRQVGRVGAVAAGVDALASLDYKITYKAVTSSRLDSKALRADQPELYAKYTKQTTARRFCLA